MKDFFTASSGGTPMCSHQDPAETSSYPDFAIGTNRGRNLEYGTLYSTRAQTSVGEVDSGLAYIRGGATAKETDGANRGYCRAESLLDGSTYRPEHCMNNVNTKKIVTIKLREPRYSHSRWAWTSNSQLFDADQIGTDKGSGNPFEDTDSPYAPQSATGAPGPNGPSSGG